MLGQIVQLYKQAVASRAITQFILKKDEISIYLSLLSSSISQYLNLSLSIYLLIHDIIHLLCIPNLFFCSLKLWEI